VDTGVYVCSVVFIDMSLCEVRGMCRCVVKQVDKYNFTFKMNVNLIK